QRANRFASFYSSEPVARMLGRGPMFDRLRMVVDIASGLSADRVLDVGCGSGPLFAPLASKGIHVSGIDPADAMVALATLEASSYPGLVDVDQRRWEELTEVDAFDLAVTLGVLDYVAQPARLLESMGRAAPHVVGSFPAPGFRLNLRKRRYGAQGVTVHGYRATEFAPLAAEAGLQVVECLPLGRVGNVVHFRRRALA
ncbi:MAG TPA: methyltransferase domain-containing protein, partial [Acidimicrobiales bacterium]|nr:methyltransferase domain-containing protein [Acidimicrobiales bacterium]